MGAASSETSSELSEIDSSLQRWSKQAKGATKRSWRLPGSDHSGNLTSGREMAVKIFSQA